LSGGGAELIEGLEQLVLEEHYELEIEMNFKWNNVANRRNQQRQRQLKHAA